jgi:3-oxoacyl-[acyl-carrier protein] reductase
MITLKGKTAIITGATGGIGASITERFLEAGAKVVISGTNQGKLEAFKDTLLTKFKDAEIFIKSCNLGEKSQIEALVKEGVEMLGGRLDILVANAGITKDGLILRMTEEDWDSVLDVNLKSAFLLSKDAVKIMMKQRYGKIVLISSVVGLSGNAGQVNYCASKAGMIGFAKSLASEVASRNITVNCVAPGFIASPMTDVLTEEQKKAILSKIPSGRLGSGGEVADASLFLASDMSSYITGQTLSVNGGMYM